MTTDGRALRRERNAALLYDAANELLVDRAFDDVAVEEICVKAGVGRATFFRIFETKGGLLRELNRRITQDASARLVSETSGDLRLRLHLVRAAVVDAWRGAGPAQVGMAQAFARSAPSSNPHAAHPELLHLVADELSRAVDDGQLSKEVPVEIAASLALLHVIAPMAQLITGQSTDLDHLSAVLLDQWLDGASISRQAELVRQDTG